MPTPSEIQTCINALTIASDPISFPLLAAQTSDAGTGISFTVNTVGDLPDLANTSIGLGQIVFVKSLCVPVISSSNEWIGLDGRVVRRDFTARKAFNFSGAPIQEPSVSTNWCSFGGKGYSFDSGLKTDGTIWSFGNNGSGQLGDNSTVASNSQLVQEATKSTNWCQSSAGRLHSLAVNTAGSLFAWGEGSCGKLGNNCTGNFSSPVREISSSTNWCQANAGGFHSLALKTDGSLWAWGFNACGQLGNCSTLARSSPVRESTSITNWLQVSAGYNFSSAITSTGCLYTWGDNTCSQLGNGTGSPCSIPRREWFCGTSWCQVSAGFRTTGAVTTGGQLWMWGDNSSGQTAQNCGSGITNTPAREISSSTNWCRVEVGRSSVVALKTDNTLWGWGNQVLGSGNSVARSSPVQSFGSTWCTICAGFFGDATGIVIE